MTTPGPPDEPTPERSSLFDRLAEFEPEDDDLFEDEYDEDPAGEGAEPPAEDEPGTAYDDSAFAAVGDEPAAHDQPDAAPQDDDGGLPPAEALEHSAAPDTAETVVLEHPAEAHAAHDTAVLDPFAAAPTPLAAAPAEPPVDAPVGATETEPALAEPAGVEPADAAAADDDTAPAEPAGRRRRSGRRLTLPVVALLIMTVLLAAATAYLWLQVREHDRTESARRSGLEASRDAARLLFSYDYRTLDKDFSTGKALTTGEFRTQYEKTTTKVVADVAKQYKAVVKANVVGAGVVRATPDTVVTVVYVNQVTTSTRVTGEKVDLSRVRMTLRRSGGRWLVTSVNAL